MQRCIRFFSCGRAPFVVDRYRYRWEVVHFREHPYVITDSLEQGQTLRFHFAVGVFRGKR